MHAIRTPALILLLSALLPASVLAQPKSIEKVNGGIQTDAGTTYHALETVNGSITLASDSSAHAVETVNGSVLLAAGARAGSVETVNGAITLNDSAQVDGDVEAVNGAIRLAAGSHVRGDVETVNGSIVLTKAQVGGIETVNGNIEVLDGSTVDGNIVVRKPSTGFFNNKRSGKPKVIIGANSVVKGELVFEREVELRVHPTAQIGRITGATAETLDVEAR